jgi:hypothetical protein
MPDQTPRDYYERRKGALKIERSSFIPHYQQLSEFIQPRRGRFQVTDHNKGEKRHQNIVNSRATQAHRIARSGMFDGTMSQARPWFSLATPDPGLMEFMPVKVWLRDTEHRLRAVFDKSNLYTMAPVLMGELILFATGFMSHVDDFEDVARFYTHTAGSYMLGQDDRFEITTACREYEMTTEQMVNEFGLDKVSRSVKDQWDKGDYDGWHPVTHFIEPNGDERTASPLSKFKAFSSVKYEPGHEDKDMILSQKGFDEFPGYAPRWDVTAEDVYGTDCPAMTALGDIRGLQLEEKRKAQAIDKSMNPPLKGPASLRNVPISSLPGGTTLFDGDAQAGQGLAPIYMVNTNIQDLMLDIERVEGRINEAFYTDLFFAISQARGIQPKNELELTFRDEERLIQLGPVLQRIHDDFLRKLIDRTFAQLHRGNLLMEAPEELEGAPLKVEFISSLAMAQRAVGIGSIDRLAGFVSGLAGVGFESVVDKFDADQAVDEYANLIGSPPRLVISDEDVAKVREQRAQQLQRQQVIEMAAQGAQAAQAAGNADLEGDNLLSRGIQAVADRA